MKMHYCAIVATGQLCKFEGQPMRSLSSSCETIDLDPACCILYTQNFLAKEVFLSEVTYLCDVGKRSIFLNFWKNYCCTKSLYFELKPLNFDYLLIS